MEVIITIAILLLIVNVGMLTVLGTVGAIFRGLGKFLLRLFGR